MIALVLLTFQFLAYSSMDGKPNNMYHSQNLSDTQSIGQWLGSFVGFNLFGLVGVGLLLFANAGKRRGTSNVESVEKLAEEPFDAVPDPEDDKDVVWEELRDWPTKAEQDGAKE